MNQEVWILHGWALGPLNQEKWQPFLNILGKVGINSHFLEIPGLDSELEKAWSLDDYTGWLSDVLPEKPVILLGHSFGGQLAVKFTSEHPGRISKLILIGPSGIKDNSIKAVVKRNVFKFAAKTGRYFTNSEILRKILYKTSRETDYLNAGPILRETMKSVINEEIADSIVKIDKPILLIWGRNDKASPYRFNEIYRKNLKNLVFKTIEDARHSPQFTKPERTAALIAEFLEIQKQ